MLWFELTDCLHRAKGLIYEADMFWR